MSIFAHIRKLRLISFVLLLWTGNSWADSVPENLGGAAASRNADHHMAMTLPRQDLDKAAFARFIDGVNLFEKDWRNDGGGPLYNALACQSCHLRDGRPAANGAADFYVVKMAAYGGQVQQLALPGFSAEARVDIRFIKGDAPAILINDQVVKDASLRQPPQLSGLGLLAAVPDQVLAALEGAQQSGPVSGRRHRVTDPVTGKPVAGRFGWKAEQPSLFSQTAKAAAEDMGLSNPVFTQQDEDGRDDITTNQITVIADYVAALAVPRHRLFDEAGQGYQLFKDTGCAHCHQPQLSLGGDITIWPFTDLLLHDMGPGLADLSMGDTPLASEWRTPPLWGIGLLDKVAKGRVRYLHDGRAASIGEAIDWHGGEAAFARDAWRAMGPADKDVLLRFLDSL